MKPFYFSAIILYMLLIACSPVKMAVSDELKKNRQEFPVKGVNGKRINQKISFGEFATTEIKRSWIKGSSFRNGFGYGGTAQQDWVNIISMEYINRKQTIRFNLSEGKYFSQVYCVSRFNARDLVVGKDPNSVLNIGLDIFDVAGEISDMYYVQLFTSEKDERPWEMTIDNHQSQARPKKDVGYLAKGPNEYYTIHPVSKMEIKGKTGNILAGSIGYEFHNEQGVSVAAVSTIDRGMVFLGNVQEEERFLLANACTALLLQETLG